MLFENIYFQTRVNPHNIFTFQVLSFSLTQRAWIFAPFLNSKNIKVAPRCHCHQLQLWLNLLSIQFPELLKRQQAQSEHFHSFLRGWNPPFLREPPLFLGTPFFLSFFFSIRIFFHNHSQITGLQGKGEGISSTPHYHFLLLHRQLDIGQAITA